MLVLEIKPYERFVLYDSVSGFSTRMKIALREGRRNRFVVLFDAPEEVKISREKLKQQIRKGLKNE